MSEPARYRKLPLTIEALQFDGTNAQQLAEWVGEEQDGWVYGDHCDYYEVDTLEGTMTAYVGDWIVRGVQGEFYPVQAAIFAASYEPAEPS